MTNHLSMSMFASFDEMKKEIMKQQKGLCDHCSDKIERGEPVAIYDHKLMHVGCAVECKEKGND